jgi:hypothetical protein
MFPHIPESWRRFNQHVCKSVCVTVLVWVHEFDKLAAHYKWGVIRLFYIRHLIILSTPSNSKLEKYKINTFGTFSWTRLCTELLGGPPSRSTSEFSFPPHHVISVCLGVQLWRNSFTTTRIASPLTLVYLRLAKPFRPSKLNIHRRTEYIVCVCVGFYFSFYFCV